MNFSNLVVSLQRNVVARPNFHKNCVLIWATIARNLKRNSFVRREIRPHQGQKSTDNYPMFSLKKWKIFLFFVINICHIESRLEIYPHQQIDHFI